MKAMSWRGVHLDVSRHFFDKEFIKEFINVLSMLDFNKFHWHLCDDQGWRLEILKYPKLTEISAYRKKADNMMYGGFYTQEDVKEIVKYASARNIEVIPEIELPGHAQAVLAAYPELSCKQEKLEVWNEWGISKHVYCAGKEASFDFLHHVLDEVFELFPGQYIHIGGDECLKEHWKTCPDCQKRMKELGLKNEEQLQSYFVKRIGRYIHQHGKQVIGWNEIMEGDLDFPAIIMAWQGNEAGKKAIEKGFKVIQTPNPYLYLDWYQTSRSNEKGYFGVTTTKDVFDYCPYLDECTDEQNSLIIGSQANIWTERIATPEEVWYMALPRLIALSESQHGNSDWQNFLNRLPSILRELALPIDVERILARAQMS